MADREGGSGRDASLLIEAELRATLGLEPGERVSLRARSARTILLERRRAGDVELPADRPLTLCVDVSAFPLPEVFN